MASRKEKCLNDLQDHFAQYSLDFSRLIKDYPLNEHERIQFISYVRYCTLYNELPKEQLVKSGNFLLLKLLYEAVDNPKLPKLTEEQSIQLAVDCQKYPREGSFLILEALKADCSLPPHAAQFIKRLQNYNYNLDCALKKTFSDTLLSFNNNAAEEAKLFHSQLKQLIKNIQDILPGWIGNGQHQHIWKLIAPYSNLDYSVDELEMFFHTFGLYNYISNDNKPVSINLILKNFLIDFSSIHTLLPHLDKIIFFLLSLLRHLHAFIKDPSLYSQGLQSLVFSTATRGTGKYAFFWIKSLLSGLHALDLHLQAHGIKTPRLPIIIFDQSPPLQFSKNSSVLQMLQQQFSFPVWHVNTQKTLLLAKKVGLQRWIKTSGAHAFGFGGARNCTLMLAPLLFAAFQNGSASLDEAMNLPPKVLQDHFNAKVAGRTDLTVHIGEDDIFLPTSRIFNDALFSHFYKDAYIFRANNRIGRAGHKLNLILDYDTVVRSPSQVFSSTAWLDKPHPVGMSGALSKPKFCLALPFGSEESHVRSLRPAFDLFEQPAVHLSGTRFPNHPYPLSPLDGLEISLKSVLPYVALTSMVINLLDPANKTGRCALPWNDASLLEKQPFTSLEELLNYVHAASTQDEARKRFWNNMSLIFNEGQAKKGDLREYIELLSRFKEKQTAPQKLQTFYQKVQNDAEEFLRLGLSAVEFYRKGLTEPHKAALGRMKGPLKGRPLCSGLYLLIDKIMSGNITPNMSARNNHRRR